MIGGKERETGKHSAKMMKYDPQTDRWTNLMSMKRAKAYFTANVLDRRIVITGMQLQSLIFLLYSDQCQGFAGTLQVL